MHGTLRVAQAVSVRHSRVHARRVAPHHLADEPGRVLGRDVRLIGRATTRGQALPLGVDDPVIAARAVRRALADAGRRASDVHALVVAAADPIPHRALTAFARRALGPRGDDVTVMGLCRAGATADVLADLAAAQVSSLCPPSGGVGIALGVARDGTSLALCVSGSGASSPTPPARR